MMLHTGPMSSSRIHDLQKVSSTPLQDKRNGYCAAGANASIFKLLSKCARHTQERVESSRRCAFIKKFPIVGL